MALPDVALAPSPALTANPPLPADPWDAPYFGGAVYLTYRPTLIPDPAAVPVTTTTTTPTTSAQPADPWDAPYFGGPVAFRYPDYPVALATLVTAEETPPSAESTLDVAAVEIIEIPVAAPIASNVGAGFSPERSLLGEKAGLLPAAPDAPSAPSAGRKSWLARLFGR